MTQLTEEQRTQTQLLVEQLSKPDFVCVCAERFCIHWQVYAVKVLSPLLDSGSQAAGLDADAIARQFIQRYYNEGTWKDKADAWLFSELTKTLHDTATAMRDKCVEKVKALLPAYQAANYAPPTNALREAITAIESLTLEPEKQK